MEVLYSVRLPISMKALPFFANYTTSCLVSPDSDPGTIIEWNTLAEHRGANHCHETMKKLKDTKQFLLQNQIKRSLQSQQRKWYGDFKESRLENPVSPPRLAENQR